MKSRRNTMKTEQWIRTSVQEQREKKVLRKDRQLKSRKGSGAASRKNRMTSSQGSTYRSGRRSTRKRAHCGNSERPNIKSLSRKTTTGRGAGNDQKIAPQRKTAQGKPIRRKTGGESNAKEGGPWKMKKTRPRTRPKEKKKKVRAKA